MPEPATTSSEAAGTTGPKPLIRLDDQQWEKLMAAIGPRLREIHADEPGEASLGALASLTAPHLLLDVLHDAGVLVLDDTDDRAHLRRIWAAMSTALHRLSEFGELTAEELDAVPAAHRAYLLGHQARHRQLAAAGSRPPEAAQSASFAWERYEHTIDPDAQLSGLGDLCAFLGGTWAETPGAGSITAGILQLIVKAQATPERLLPLAQAFPREVIAWQTWMRMRPVPTARELYEALTPVGALRIVRGEHGPSVGRR